MKRKKEKIIKKKKKEENTKNKKNKNKKKKGKKKNNDKKEIKEIKENNENTNNKKEINKFEQNKLEFYPLYNIENNQNIYKIKDEKLKLNGISLDNEEINRENKSKNLLTLEEIDNDLTEISENIEKLFLQMDTSLIQDEKYLIDSIVIEAKKNGLLEETFGEIKQEKDEDQQIIKDNNSLEKSKHKINNQKIKINVKNNNKNKINMSKIYNSKRNNENINNNYNNKNNINLNKNNFPYDPNKHKAYYESLNNKMKKSIDSKNSNQSNYLINSNQKQSGFYNNNNDDINNDKFNNNINNENFKNHPYYNKIIVLPNNIDNNINMNAKNNLLSSTETTGPFRYMRKNNDEPNLIDLLMNK